MTVKCVQDMLHYHFPEVTYAFLRGDFRPSLKKENGGELNHYKPRGSIAVQARDLPVLYARHCLAASLLLDVCAFRTYANERMRSAHTAIDRTLLAREASG